MDNLQYSKIVFCPHCEGKLCKLDSINEISRIHFKHKGSEVLTKEAVIKCVRCSRYYIVTADEGIIKEVDIG